MVILIKRKVGETPVKHLVIFSLSLLLLACQKPGETPRVEPVTDDATEAFVRSELMNEKGWLQTNRTTRKTEYLSESLGLWMLVLVATDDEQTFQAIVDTLPEWFSPNNLVYWEKVDGKNAPSNAWIDDFRIAYALHIAAEKWPSTNYEKLSEKLIQQLVTHHSVDHTLIDFYDLKSNQAGNVQTMSYYNEWGMQQLLAKPLYEEYVTHRLQESKDGSIFPPTRYIVGEGYEFDAEVNLIDVLYTLLYRESWGEVEKASYRYLVSTYEETNELYGRVNRATNNPLVTYEAPAVYALFGLVAWQRGDEQLATELLAKLQRQRVQTGPNEGAFMDVATGELHVFDHLLYLLLERAVAHGAVE